MAKKNADKTPATSPRHEQAVTTLIDTLQVDTSKLSTALKKAEGKLSRLELKVIAQSPADARAAARRLSGARAGVILDGTELRVEIGQAVAAKATVTAAATVHDPKA